MQIESSSSSIRALDTQIAALSLSREELQTKTYALWLALLKSPCLAHIRPGSLDSGLRRICETCTTPEDKVSLLVLGEQPFRVYVYKIEKQTPTFVATLILDGPMTFSHVVNMEKERSLIPVSKIENLFDALTPLYGAPLVLKSDGRSLYDLGQSQLHQKFSDLTFLKRLYKHQKPLSSFTYSEEAVCDDRLFLDEFRRFFSPDKLGTFKTTKLCLSHQFYIVSQSSCGESFWNAIIESKTSLIVSFSDECWDTEIRSSDWKITPSGTEPLSSEITKRMFCVTSGNGKRFITHLECDFGDDFENNFIKLLNIIDEYRPSKSGIPIWIHGPSSVGRLATLAVVDNIWYRILKQQGARLRTDQIMCNPRLDICSARMQHCDAVHPGHISILHKLYDRMRAMTK